MTGDDEFDEIPADSLLGYGGMIVRDGTGTPMPLSQALAAMVPRWLEEAPPRLDDIVGLLLDAMSLTPPRDADLRREAIRGLALVAERHSLSQWRGDIERVISIAEKEDPEVRTMVAAIRRDLSAR